MFKNLNWIAVIIFYYLLESILLGTITWTVWHFLLFPRFGFDLTYLEWVSVVFIIKLVFNNIFAAASIINTEPNEENIENDEDNKFIVNK